MCVFRQGQMKYQHSRVHLYESSLAKLLGLQLGLVALCVFFCRNYFPDVALLCTLLVLGLPMGITHEWASQHCHLYICVP